MCRLAQNNAKHSCSQHIFSQELLQLRVIIFVLSLHLHSLLAWRLTSKHNRLAGLLEHWCCSSFKRSFHPAFLYSNTQLSCNIAVPSSICQGSGSCITQIQYLPINMCLTSSNKGSLWQHVSACACLHFEHILSKLTSV